MTNEEAQAIIKEYNNKAGRRPAKYAEAMIQLGLTPTTPKANLQPKENNKAIDAIAPAHPANEKWRYVRALNWQAHKMKTLTPLALLTLKYLETAPESNSLGIYQVAIGTITTNTNVNNITITAQCINELQDAGYITYKDGYVTVNEFRSEQKTIGNKQNLIGILKIYNSLPNTVKLPYICSIDVSSELDVLISAYQRIVNAITLMGMITAGKQPQDTDMLEVWSIQEAMTIYNGAHALDATNIQTPSKIGEMVIKDNSVTSPAMLDEVEPVTLQPVTKIEPIEEPQKQIQEVVEPVTPQPVTEVVIPQPVTVEQDPEVEPTEQVTQEETLNLTQPDNRMIIDWFSRFYNKDYQLFFEQYTQNEVFKNAVHAELDAIRKLNYTQITFNQFKEIMTTRSQQAQEPKETPETTPQAGELDLHNVDDTLIVQWLSLKWGLSLKEMTANYKQESFRNETINHLNKLMSLGYRMVDYKTFVNFNVQPKEVTVEPVTEATEQITIEPVTQEQEPQQVVQDPEVEVTKQVTKEEFDYVVSAPYDEADDEDLLFNKPVSTPTQAKPLEQELVMLFNSQPQQPVIKAVDEDIVMGIMNELLIDTNDIVKYDSICALLKSGASKENVKNYMLEKINEEIENEYKYTKRFKKLIEMEN